MPPLSTEPGWMDEASYWLRAYCHMIQPPVPATAINVYMQYVNTVYLYTCIRKLMRGKVFLIPRKLLGQSK